MNKKHIKQLKRRFEILQTDGSNDGVEPNIYSQANMLRFLEKNIQTIKMCSYNAAWHSRHGSKKRVIITFRNDDMQYVINDSLSLVNQIDTKEDLSNIHWGHGTATDILNIVETCSEELKDCMFVNKIFNK